METENNLNETLQTESFTVDPAPAGYSAEPGAADSYAAANQSASGPTPFAEAPKKKKKGGFRKFMARALAVVLIGAVAFGCGYGGVLLGYSDLQPVVIQKVDGPSSGTSVTTGLSSEQIAAKTVPTVVAITTERMTTGNFWYGSYVTSGAGSGVIISEDGYILTSAHVITGATNITVEISTGEKHKAKVVGSFVDGDIAVLKIDAEDLPYATVADSSAVVQGEPVYAVGNPEGRFSGAISDGIMGSLNRSITVAVETESNNQGNNYYGGLFGFGSTEKTISLKVFQFTAAISPGNSGGGLFNGDGHLIGIVCAKSSSTSSEGLSFAIPSNIVMDVAKELIATGTYSGNPANGSTISTNKAVLGVSISDLTTEEANKIGYLNGGVYITKINSKSTSDAGLQVGDRLISIDDNLISVSTDLTDYLAKKNPGDVVEVSVERSRKMLTFEVTLVKNAAIE